ncbi:MAG: response regulator [Anaerolineales bacterium]|nr:response regulator [Anaerolineales bacterium]
MEQNVFNGLFKDLMNHIFDYAVLETHPLAGMIELPQDYQFGRAHFIQQVVSQAIEGLRPPDREFAPSAPEWRPYLILHGRYTQGNTPQALADELHLSERQLRRDHSRALQALAGRLWDQVFQKMFADSSEQAEQDYQALRAFPLTPEILDLSQVLQGVMATMQPRASAENISLHFESASGPHMVLTDRIILRQILFSLCNYAMHLQIDRTVHVQVQIVDNSCVVTIQVNVDDTWATWDADEREDSLESARYWAQRLDATLVEEYPQQTTGGVVSLTLALPGSSQPVVLVVDDQQPTLRMYQRYLSRLPLKVVGVHDPAQVLQLANQLQPALILLDVMMPQVDGWEILQALRLDVQTQKIPIIVCSAWEAAELARSLGASDFLKKPITQKGLLAALKLLGI